MRDTDVLSESVDSGRILLTEDKDFGELVFAAGQRSCGVVLFRFPEHTRHLLVERSLYLLDRHADHLENSFIVVEPERIRFGPLT